MSKTTLLGFIGFIIIFGGYALFNSNKPKDVTPAPVGGEAPVVENAGESTAVPAGKKIAFSELLKQAGTYKCTVNQDVSGITSKGTVYMNKGMISGEFNTAMQGITVDSGFIVRDGYTYSWSSALPHTVFKIKMATGSVIRADGSTSTSNPYIFNGEQIGDYNCESWSPDASKFVVPTDRTISDISPQ